MKRTVLFALVGVIALAFASCGEKQSKEFTEKKAAIESMITEVTGITTCDAIDMLNEKLNNLTNGEYAEADRMNDKERGVIAPLMDKLTTAISDKVQELGGCVKEEEAPAAAEVQLDENGNPILDAAEAAVEQAGEAVQQGVENVVNEVKDAIQG